MSLADHLRALLAEMLQARSDATASAEEPKREALAVDAWRQRLSWSTRVSRALGVRGYDRVTAVGESVQVPVANDPVRRLRAHRARISIADQIVLDVPVGELPESFDHRPTRAGLLEVRTEWLDAEGGLVYSFLPTPPAFLQVIDRRTTIGIDAALLLEHPHVGVQLRALLLRDCEVFYFDTFGLDRTAEIREAIDRLGLPPAAVLSHSEREPEVRTLGVDFRAVFLTITLRRLRGGGIPLVGLVSSAPESAMAAQRANVVVVDPSASASWWSEEWPARAQAYLAAASTSPLSLRLDRMTETRTTPGNVCHVELDNADARRRLLQLVDAAERSIHLQFYLVRAGSFADRLGAHLVRAARRGVKVRLLVDALYSLDGIAGATNAVVRGLSSEPGIEVVSSVPILTRADIEPLALKRRDHRKIIAIDGRVAIVGGRNCADEYWTGFDEIAVADWTVHDRIPWFDAHVEVEGPLVSSVEEAFLTAWTAAGGSPYPGIEPSPAPRGTVDARLVLHNGVWDAAAMLAYEALIEGADHHVYIVNDFPIVQSLRMALRRAAARGVAIRILTGSAVARRGDGTFFEGPLHRQAFEYMTKQRLEDLLQVGAHVFEMITSPQPLIVCRGGVVRPYVHAKIVTADGLAASVGSANLDATASYWEREANVIIEDAELVTELERQLQSYCDRGHAVDMSSEDWRRDRILRELAAQLWPEALYA